MSSGAEPGKGPAWGARVKLSQQTPQCYVLCRKGLWHGGQAVPRGYGELQELPGALPWEL